MYHCYLNGSFYGSGDLKYMHELFKDYVLTCEMYGRKECEFKIVNTENESVKKTPANNKKTLFTLSNVTNS